MMRQVIVALLPAIAVATFLFGFGTLIHLAIAVPIALLCETLALRWRKIDPQPFLRDGSVLVLAFLLALAIPPYAPWWVTVVGVAFATLIGKHAFGGLGHNIFNPAMVGYIFLLLCFPLTLSRWPELAKLNDYPGLFDSLRLIFGGSVAALDGISGATALDHVKTQIALMRMHSEMQAEEVFGIVGARGWEWVNFAFLLGGGWLLARGVVGWRLPVSFTVGLGVSAMLGAIGDPELHRGVLFHLFTGGAMLAAFFVVTDPVSSATTPRGMLVFGFGIGLLTYLIREFGSYPDGIAFAVVIMNSLAPLIDRVTQPRLYGNTSNKDL